MSARKTSTPVAIATALVVTGLWIAMAGMFKVEYGDFPAFYTGATLAKQGKFASLHDDTQQAQLQNEFLKVSRVPVYFVRPHVYALVLSPLARLPLRQAFYVWCMVQGLILLAIAAWARRRFGNDALVLLALFPAPVLAIGFGQDTVVYLGLAVLGFVFYERGWLMTAGFSLGCAMVKPHLVLLVPAVMLFQKRWRMLAGFALGGLLEAGISLYLAGRQGAELYLAFLRKQEGHLTPHPERMLNVQGVMANLDLEHGGIRWALAAAVLLGVLLVARRNGWIGGFAASSIGTMLIAPHVFMYDSTLAALPALLLFFEDLGAKARIAATVFFTPIPYLIQLADIPWTIVPALVLCAMFIALLLEKKRMLSPSPTSASVAR